MGGKTKEQEADAKAAELAERSRIMIAYKQWDDGGRVGRHVIGRPGKDTQKPCSECGAYGHMKTNKICPLYEEDEFQAPKKAPRRSKPVQEAQGTKLTMSRRDIQPTAPGLKFSKRRIEEAKAATRDKNRKKQYSAIDDNEYDEKYRPRVKRQRAGRGTAYMRWCEAVEKLIIEELEREEHATVFMHPVSKKDAPTYHLKSRSPSVSGKFGRIFASMAIQKRINSLQTFSLCSTTVGRSTAARHQTICPTGRMRCRASSITLWSRMRHT